MLRVIEVAELLGVSKVTIYKKIKNLDGLKKHLVKKQNITYINNDGIELIKKDLEKFKINESEKVLDITFQNSINHLVEYNEELKKQISIKQIQMNVKDKQVENTKELIKMNKRRFKLLKEMMSK